MPAADAVLTGHGGRQDIEVAVGLDDLAEEVVAEAAMGVRLVGDGGFRSLRNGFIGLVRGDRWDIDFLAGFPDCFFSDSGSGLECRHLRPGRFGGLRFEPLRIGHGGQ